MLGSPKKDPNTDKKTGQKITTEKRVNHGLY